MNTEQIYQSYRSYCGSVGVEPASKEVWQQFSYESPFRDVNTNGMDRIQRHKGRKLRRAWVYRIGDALGVADEIAMLKSLRLIDDNGVTAKGRKHSKVREINGVDYRLWNISTVGKMLGQFEAEPVPETPATFAEVDPDVVVLLHNSELDLLPAPESHVEITA